MLVNEAHCFVPFPEVKIISLCYYLYLCVMYYPYLSRSARKEQQHQVEVVLATFKRNTKCCCLTFCHAAAVKPLTSPYCDATVGGSTFPVIHFELYTLDLGHCKIEHSGHFQ